MREIKFRGKRVDTGEWVHGDLHQKIWIDGKSIEVAIYTKGGLIYSVIPETVGQFTGLTDKNGVEIYEGDIVASLQHDIIFTVCFGECENATATFYFDNNGKKYIFDKSHVKMTVIGNINDNSEMTK